MFEISKAEMVDLHSGNNYIINNCMCYVCAWEQVLCYVLCLCLGTRVEGIMPISVNTIYHFSIILMNQDRSHVKKDQNALLKYQFPSFSFILKIVV